MSDSKPSTTPNQLAGRLLGGRYLLLSLIAQGGMGEVWKARDRVTGRTLAAKVLRPELSGQELSLSRLRIEARNAMSVEHPNIANVLDSGEENGRGWIIMELVEGRPLTDYLRGGQSISPEYLMPILMQIAMALGAAAQAGVVHRDIKPANVLIRPDGMVKLTDFGISRTDSQIDLTADGMVMGTAQYLPPEQAMGEKATSLGDLYALGVIAYEAAAGVRPFTGKSQVDIAFAHVNEPVPALPDSVPEPLARVIYHLLDKDPQRRPESGSALVRELVAAGSEMGVSLRARPLPPPTVEAPHHGAPPTPGAPAVETRVNPTLRSGAPVQHTQRRSLPADLLEPVDLEAQAAKPSLAARKPAASRMGSVPRTPRLPETTTPEAQAAKPAAPTRQSRPSPTKATAASAEMPRRRRSATRPQRVTINPALIRWHAVTEENGTIRTSAPVKTRYNRSVVAPEPTRKDQIGKWLVIFLISLTIFLIAVATIHNRFGSLLHRTSAEVSSNQEVTTWQIPPLEF